MRNREFRGFFEPAELLLIGFPEALIGSIQVLYVWLPRPDDLHGRDVSENGGGDALYLLLFVPPGIGDRGQDGDDVGHAESSFAGDICGGKERYLLRGHDDRKRPSTSTGHGLAGFHVELVNIRPLLPVHLDADELIVQDPGHILVLK